MSKELRTTAWLLLQDGGSIAPADCICHDGLQSHIRKLRKLGAGVAHKDDLKTEVIAHENWSRHVRDMCPSGKVMFQKIAECLTNLNEYAIGLDIATKLKDFKLSEFIEIFSSAPEDTMPASFLLDALIVNSRMDHSEEAAASLILPKIQVRLSFDRYVSVLNHLTGPKSGNIRTIRRKEYFDHYFAEAIQFEDSKKLLTRIQLCNRKGQWVSPASLTYSATNISDETIIDATQELILQQSHQAEPVGSRSLQDDMENSVRIRLHFDEDALAESANILWGELNKGPADTLPRDAVGALVAILGVKDGYPKIFDKLFANRTYEAMLRLLGITGTGKRFCVRLANASSVAAVNLLGGIFDAKVHREVSSFFDPLPRQLEYLPRPDGDQYFELWIRPVDPGSLTSQRKLEIIGNSVREIRRRIWNKNSEFDSLWEKLGRGDQIPIDVAQEMILDASVGILENQLSTADSPTLKELFRKLHDARTAKILAKNDGDYSQEVAASGKQDSLLNELRRVLVEDVQVKEVLLGRIQRKLRSQSYEKASIPFELFQNADDAVVELDELRAEELDADIRIESVRYSFKVEVDSDSRTIRFYHWGRAINQCHTGERKIDGYDRDMERMLILQATGKEISAADQTGKFGLGFKSVFFVCDEPKVLSGSQSRFCVKSGVYPARLEADDEARLRSKLIAFEGRDPCSGTVIELSLRSSVSPADVMSRFSRLSDYLVLFSRRIKTCQIHFMSSHLSGWNYRKLIPQIDIATSLSPAIGQVLLFRLDGSPSQFSANQNEACPQYRTLLVHLDADGLPLRRKKSFDSNLDAFPEIWVTTPTKHTGSGSLLINADFDVNPGRTQLQFPETDKNKNVVRGMGKQLGELLTSLYSAFIQNGEKVNELTSVPQLATSDIFWRRFWDVTSSYLGADKANPIRRILFDVDCGLNRLIRQAQVIPSGLPAPYDCLLKLPDIRWKTGGLLQENDSWLKCQQGVFPACECAEQSRTSRNAAVLADIEASITALSTDKVTAGTKSDGTPLNSDRTEPFTDSDELKCHRCSWSSWFTTAFPTSQVVSAGTAIQLQSILKSDDPEFESRLPDISELRLTTIVSELLKATSCFKPKDADRLGHVFNDQLMLALDWTGDVRNTLSRFRQASFISRAGTEVNVLKLRVQNSAATEMEERMLAAFAPNDLVLSTAYEGVGLAFFQLCRGYRPEESSQLLTEWCYGIGNDSEKQKAVATYLAKGAKAHELNLKTEGTWFEDEAVLAAAVVHLTQGEQAVVYARLNKVHPTAPKTIEPERTTVERSPRLVKEILKDIESWWSENRESLLLEHDQRVYPFGCVPSVDLNATPSQLESDPAIRREWLVLLIRGQVFRLGHDDDQQRGFLEFFSERRFLDLFAETTFDSEDFISAIDEYLNLSGPLQVYFHWMNQMLAYYQLSRWLPRYATAFASATRPGAVLTDLGNLRDITNLPDSNLYSRSTGFDAPASARTFSLGAHFILREIVRARFRSSLDYRVDPKICQLSYVPSESVKRLFLQITGNEAFALPADHEILSKAMFSTVTEHVEDPTFSSCFDIPFRMLTWDAHAKKRREILGLESESPAVLGDTPVSPNADSGVT